MFTLPRSGPFSQILSHMSQLLYVLFPLPTVTLAPVGEIHVCKGNDQQFNCMASPLALWTISGFGSGIEDSMSTTTANSYANLSGNSRVKSNDTSALAMPSFLTFKNLGYADDNAVVACEDASQMVAMTTIRIGKLMCKLILTCISVCISSIMQYFVGNQIILIV